MKRDAMIGFARLARDPTRAIKGELGVRSDGREINPS